MVDARDESGGRGAIDLGAGPPCCPAPHDYSGQSWLRSLARRRPHSSRSQRPDEAEADFTYQLVPAVSRWHTHSASPAWPKTGSRGGRSKCGKMCERHVLHFHRGFAGRGKPRSHFHSAHTKGEGLLWVRYIRPA